MSMGDKPAVIARDAQEAAKRAQEASDTIQAIPGSFPYKDVVLKVLGGITVVGGTVGTALTAGTLPAIVFGAASLATFFAGLFHTTPAK